ncbi:hypothetical protein BJV74DRAFT_82635 [Russula compacta]|nr:hypothetical protein BJV74DRAFT_82635 [Russula compacta]
MTPTISVPRSRFGFLGRSGVRGPRRPPPRALTRVGFRLRFQLSRYPEFSPFFIRVPRPTDGPSPVITFNSMIIPFSGRLLSSTCIISRIHRRVVTALSSDTLWLVRAAGWMIPPGSTASAVPGPSDVCLLLHSVAIPWPVLFVVRQENTISLLQVQCERGGGVWRASWRSFQSVSAADNSVAFQVRSR